MLFTECAPFLLVELEYLRVVGAMRDKAHWERKVLSIDCI